MLPSKSKSPPASKFWIETAGPVDLLVTYIGLPGIMDGHRLVEAVRTRQPDAKVILVSGSCDGAQSRAVQRDPSVGFLAKPYDRAELAGAVRHALKPAPSHNVVPSELVDPA